LAKPDIIKWKVLRHVLVKITFPSPDFFFSIHEVSQNILLTFLQPFFFFLRWSDLLNWCTREQVPGRCFLSSFLQRIMTSEHLRSALCLLRGSLSCSSARQASASPPDGMGRIHIFSLWLESNWKHLAHSMGII
jgi:hypothetical protein